MLWQPRWRLHGLLLTGRCRQVGLRRRSGRWRRRGRRRSCCAGQEAPAGAWPQPGQRGGPRACQAAVIIDQDLINKLAKGTALGATVQTLRGKPLGLQFTLEGFTKAYAAFKKGVTQ